ncbi:hypothetical protein JRQ81_004620 [Phrynocephalus forsythii]|uniref:Vitelline membrane outer layer protein 1 homolog n=1 Tax=Phrynocephalus forsythii TaxID=171643 RepID=A0A9Q0XG19_9SAUR|nr:hypothetical protein JRQ81_004620 [Phrynocephalus forsythii]
MQSEGGECLWGHTERCVRANILDEEMEPYQGAIKDDTAMNGLRLFCTRGGRQHRLEDNPVESQSGPWGRWSEPQWCSTGSYLVGFSLRVEPIRPTAQDYMGATDIRMACSDGQILEGEGLSYGEYGEWSPPCGKGVCGIQTKVEPQRGALKDDSALNDCRLLCCTG